MTPQFVQHCGDIASLVINRMLMYCISIQNWLRSKNVVIYVSDSILKFRIISWTKDHLIIICNQDFIDHVFKWTIFFFGDLFTYDKCTRFYPK
jgi:hypothetical protein